MFGSDDDMDPNPTPDADRYPGVSGEVDESSDSTEDRSPQEQEPKEEKQPQGGDPKRERQSQPAGGGSDRNKMSTTGGGNVPHWLNLRPDEEIYYRSHPHLFNYAAEIFLGCSLIVVGIALALGLLGVSGIITTYLGISPILIAIGGIVVGGLFILTSLFRQRIHHYVITNKRLYDRWKFISGVDRTVPYYKISNAGRTQTIAQRLVSIFQLGNDVGTIVIQTAGTDGAEVVLFNIERSTDIHNYLQSKRLENTSEDKRDLSE